MTREHPALAPSLRSTSWPALVVVMTLAALPLGSSAATGKDPVAVPQGPVKCTRAAGEVASGAAVVGSWATYRRSSALTTEYPVLTQAAGQAIVSLSQEKEPPTTVYVTYSIVRGDAKSYVLQIVTSQTPDGKPLAITQITIDRGSGKDRSGVTQRPAGKGPRLIATEECGVRPLRAASGSGTSESVAVEGGRFTALRMPYQNGSVWVSDQVPAMGLVKAVFPNATLELVKSGTAGAKDLLRS
jgi:hypothetical protein